MAARSNRYFGALVLVAAFIPLPFLAALITIIAYLSPAPPPAGAFFDSLGTGNMVVILGLIITLVLWLLLAIPCRHFATAEGARPSDYEGLKRNYQVLWREFEQVKKCKKTGDIAIADIQSNLDGIDNMLNRNGLTWLSTGYVSLWDRINQADEAIIDVLPCKTVIESAKYEELRLNNSMVPDSKDLLTLLEKAIQTLSSDPNCSKQSSEQNQDTNIQATDPPVPSAANNGQGSQQSVQEARADIRKVKAALHNFTNERWDGLVRARNQLMGTAFLTAVFTYILVVIAILANIPPMRILEAMVFYFFGAIVGLFGRLVDERNTDRVIDDYGLSMTRIIVTPFLSGLAALVGVWLAIILAISIGSISTIPIQIATTYGLLNIYPQNLVFAAVFGFAPNLVINILRSKSEEIKGQINSASPSDQKK